MLDRHDIYIYIERERETTYIPFYTEFFHQLHGPARTEPRCVFIDLGAADGNTFDSFLANGYGPVKNCPRHGEWQAILVEAEGMG